MILDSRFKRTGDLADIQNAMSNQQCAVELIPLGHTDLPLRLSNLRNPFQFRFGWTRRDWRLRRHRERNQLAVDQSLFTVISKYQVNAVTSTT